METELGKKIKERRKELKLSQRELAAKVNISDAEICRIETGSRKQPSPEALRDIAAALDMPVSELYEICGYINPNDTISMNAIKENPDDYIFIGDLSPSEIEDVKKYINFIKSQR